MSTHSCACADPESRPRIDLRRAEAAYRERVGSGESCWGGWLRGYRVKRAGHRFGEGAQIKIFAPRTDIKEIKRLRGAEIRCVKAPIPPV